jgi:hypothetical protein
MTLKPNYSILFIILCLCFHACRKAPAKPEPNPLTYTKNMAGTRKWIGTTNIDWVTSDYSTYATLTVVNDSTVIFDTTPLFRYKLKYVYHNKGSSKLVYVYDSRGGVRTPMIGVLDSLIYCYADSSMRFYHYKVTKSSQAEYDLNTP